MPPGQKNNELGEQEAMNKALIVDYKFLVEGISHDKIETYLLLHCLASIVVGATAHSFAGARWYYI
jgi:hypothetical protein